MAVLKERLNRKNSSGTYDTIYLETSSAVVIMADGKTLEATITAMNTAIGGKAAASHGTHVTFSTTAPAMNGTAAVGTATTVSRSDHVHPTDTSRAASSHNHAASAITSGTLAIARGGTGLTASPSMLTNLASTTAANVLVASPRPGVTGTLPLGNGGTGKTTAPLALYALINGSTALASTGLADTDVIGIGDVSAATGKKVTLANLKTWLGVGASGDDTVTKSNAVGDLVKWAGHWWVVVHRDASYMYLAYYCIYSKTAFGSSTTYSGSTIAAACTTFLNSLSSTYQSQAISMTIEGVSNKIWIPTYTQASSTFLYYAMSATNRVANYSGTATVWWLATAFSSSYVYYVGSGGGLHGNDAPSFSLGFRPHVALAAS